MKFEPSFDQVNLKIMCELEVDRGTIAKDNFGALKNQIDQVDGYLTILHSCVYIFNVDMKMLLCMA